MRIILFMLILLPAVAFAADWVEVGKTHSVRIMLDKASIEPSGQAIKAWLKFIYSTEQNPQTVTNGKPFDSSRNLYYVVCSTKKYQVLQLIMYHRNDIVGTFHQYRTLDDLDDAASNPHVLSFLSKVCAASNLDAATAKN